MLGQKTLQKMLWYYMAYMLKFLNGLLSLGKKKSYFIGFHDYRQPPQPYTTTFKNTPTKLNLLNLLAHKLEQAALSKQILSVFSLPNN